MGSKLTIQATIEIELPPFNPGRYILELGLAPRIRIQGYALQEINLPELEVAHGKKLKIIGIREGASIEIGGTLVANGPEGEVWDYIDCDTPAIRGV